MADANLIGRCGIYCGACPLYINTKCEGCRAPATEECAIARCAEAAGVDYCGVCTKFPCELHYRDNIAVYSRAYLEWKKRTVSGHE